MGHCAQDLKSKTQWRRKNLWPPSLVSLLQKKNRNRANRRTNGAETVPYLPAKPLLLQLFSLLKQRESTGRAVYRLHH